MNTPASLVELLDQIIRASTFVGNDSGPGHLAGILGIPTVSIFGPRDSGHWKPLGPNVRTVHGPWQSIAVDDVLKAIDAK